MGIGESFGRGWATLWVDVCLLFGVEGDSRACYPFEWPEEPWSCVVSCASCGAFCCNASLNIVDAAFLVAFHGACCIM